MAEGLSRIRNWLPRPAYRGVALAVTIALVLGAVGITVAVLDVSDDGSSSGVADQNELSFDGTRTAQDITAVGTFLGHLDNDPNTFVALVADGSTLRAYVCDGAKLGAWFGGALVGSSFDLDTKGSRLTGALGEGRIVGSFTTAKGSVSSFTASLSTRDGGLFRTDADVDVDRLVAGWVVTDDGDVRGLGTLRPLQSPAAGTEAKPRQIAVPTIEAAATRITPTATLDLSDAGASAVAVPVVEITAASLTGSRPTLASAPRVTRPDDVLQTAKTLGELAANAQPTLIRQPAAVAASAGFEPSAVAAGGTSLYKLTLTNPNASAVHGASVNLGFPDPVVPNLATVRSDCNGTVAAVDPNLRITGDPQVVVSGVTLEAGAACTVSVSVTVESGAFRVVSGAPTALDADTGKPALALVQAGQTGPAVSLPSGGPTAPAKPSIERATPVVVGQTPGGPTRATRATRATPLVVPRQTPLTTVAIQISVSTLIGASPLAVTLNPVLPSAAPRVTDWTWSFSDGARPVTGVGALTPIPKTWVNDGTKQISASATLLVKFDDGTKSTAQVVFTVMPKGAAPVAAVADSSGPAERTKKFAVTVRIMNGALSTLNVSNLSFDALGLSSIAGEKWTCASRTCSADPIAPQSASTPLTLTFDSVPVTTPASLVIRYGTGTGLKGEFAVDVIGFGVDAGPDQRVDAVTTKPDGTTVGTRVILDGSRSTPSLGGTPRVFTWTQIAGPAVTLRTDVDPSMQRVAFDSPTNLAANTTLTFQLAVSDNSFSGTDTVSVTLLRPNRAPQVSVRATAITAQADGSIVPASGATSVALSASATDADADAVSFTWRTPGVTSTLTPSTTAAARPTSGTASVSSSTTLTWPIAGKSQVIVEVIATDAFGRTDSTSILIGAAPAPLTMTVAPSSTSAAGGSQVTLTALPSRSTGVTVTWAQTSGPAAVLSATSGTSVRATLPPTVTGPATVTFRATARESATATTLTSDVSILATAAPPLSLVVQPAQSVALNATVSLAATTTPASGVTVRWSQLSGPPVTIANASAAQASFTAPGTGTVIVIRATASNGVATAIADQVVNVGALPAPVSGATDCATDSVFARIWRGDRVLAIGNSSTVLITGVTGNSGTCNPATTLRLSGVNINLFQFILGDGLTATADASKLCFTAGTVKLASQYNLPPITIGSTPICLVYSSIPGAVLSAGPSRTTSHPAPRGLVRQQQPCVVPLTGQFSIPGAIPFLAPPAGVTPGTTTISFGCSGVQLTSSASFSGGGSVQLAGTLSANGRGSVTISPQNLSIFGGTASGSITVTVGASVAFAGEITINNAVLPLGPGVTINRLGLSYRNGTFGINGRITLGAADPRLVLDLAGNFSGPDSFAATVTTSTANWAPAPNLTISAGSLTGTITRSPTATTMQLTAAATGAWAITPGVSISSVSVSIGNSAAPPECGTLAAGSVWLNLGGVAALTIPGRSPINTQVNGCAGLPGATSGTAASPVFSLRAAASLGTLRPDPSGEVTLDRAEFRASYQGQILEVGIYGDLRIAGLPLSGKAIFRSGPDGPVFVVVASGDVSALGTPIRSGTLVYSTGAVTAFPIDAATTLDLQPGLAVIATIDLDTATRQLLNQTLKPTTPIGATLVVSAQLGGPDLVLTAVLSLGTNGVTLFDTCATAPCDPNAASTTSLRLMSAFIKIRVGPAGFQIGIGGTAKLFLPPQNATSGAVRSSVDLGIEAFFRPPAEVGLSLYLLSSTGWQNAFGVNGLTVNALVVQGSVDFTVPSAPVPSIGLLAEVSSIGDLGPVLGLTNNGEKIRAAVNISPKNPIVEFTIGQLDGRTVMQPLRNLDGSSTDLDQSLTVDAASIVIAPLGGSIGPVVYSPGINIAFGATLLGTPIEVRAAVDVAQLRITANLNIGAFAIGGVRVNNTELLLDIQPLGARLRIGGSVQLPGGPALTSVFDVQVGVLEALSQSSAPAPSTSLPRPTAGISLVADLQASEWLVAPGTGVRSLKLHSEAALDALSAPFAMVFSASASVSVAGQNLQMAGDARFVNGEFKELHVRANPGTFTLGSIAVSGDGRCQGSIAQPGPTTTTSTTLDPILVTTAAPKVTTTVAATTATTTTVPRLGTSGPCLQFDYIPGGAPAFGVGIRGTITAATAVTKIVGTIDDRKINLQGETTLGELGVMNVSGVLYHGADSTLGDFRIKVREEDTAVVPQQGSWRVDGTFASPKALAGVQAPWSFNAGSVDPVGTRARVSWASIKGDISRPGFNLKVIGDTVFSSTSMQYTLRGESALKADTQAITINPDPDPLTDPARNTIHGAVRPVVFALAPTPESGQRFLEQVRGKLRFAASYSLEVVLSNVSGTSNLFRFRGDASMKYIEGFKRNATTGADTLGFNDELESGWNVLDLSLEIDSTTGAACYRWSGKGFDFNVGSCP